MGKTAESAKEPDPRPRGAARQLRVLALLAGADRPLTTREVGERLQLPRPSAHRLLQALVDDGFAISEGNPTRFRASWLMVELGFQIASASRVRDAMLQAGPALVRRVRYGAIVSFYERGTVVCTDTIDLWNGDPVTRLFGHRFVAEQTAAGRVFLAHLAPEDLPADLETGIREHLAVIRAQGFETRSAQQAPEPGTRMAGIAVPVFDQNFAVAGALGLTVPPNLEVAEIQTLVGELQSAAASASAALGSQHAVHA